jgi:hypothetical protein
MNEKGQPKSSSIGFGWQPEYSSLSILVRVFWPEHPCPDILTQIFQSK